MARRATYLLSAPQHSTLTLTVAGPFEFAHAAMNPEPEKLRAMSEALSYLRYDVGALSSHEYMLMKKHGISLPPLWLSHHEDPLRILKIGPNTIAIIYLPELSPQAVTVDKKSYAKIGQLVKAAQKKAKLVIAVSDWGIKAELNYLSTLSSDQPCPDIFLGSGSGSGIIGRVSAQGKTYYVRPYEKGKSVATISVKQWPVRASEFQWTPSKNIHSKLIVLDKQFTEDAIINNIFSMVTKSNENKGEQHVQRSLYRPLNPLRVRESR